MNRIQNLRKSNGYEITDKIAVTIESNDEVNTAVANFKDYIAAQVLAQSLIVADKVENPIALDFEDFVVNISIEKV